MKNKGFSVIEIVLVLGVIGILATFIVPKTRAYLAMAKDNKMITTLNGIRMASESYFLDNGKEFFLSGDEEPAITQAELDELQRYLNDSLTLTGEKLLLEIGGSKTGEEIKYGGSVEVYIDNNNEIKIRAEEGVGESTIKGETWDEI